MKRSPSVALMRPLSSGIRLSFALGMAGVFASSGFAAGTSKDTYYVNDHLATTVSTSDAAGEIAQIESDAFGTQEGPVAKDSRFTGKPYDADLGAYVFPFRNYRAGEARWMSVDPSGFPDGMNALRYSPNALSGIDPLGLMSGVVETDYWYYNYYEVSNVALAGIVLSAAGTVVAEAKVGTSGLALGMTVTGAAISSASSSTTHTISSLFSTDISGSVADGFHDIGTTPLDPITTSYDGSTIGILTTIFKFKTTFSEQHVWTE